MIEETNSFGQFPWRRAVRIYLNIISELSGKRTEQYSKRLFSILGPASRTSQGIEIFLNLINSLIQKLQTFTTPEELPYSTDRSVAKSNRKQDVTILKIEHNFSETFQAGIDTGHGIEYYGDSLVPNYSGPLTITLANILSRFADESVKKSEPVPQPSDIENYKKFYSHLTPSRITSPSRVYDLLGPESEKNTIESQAYLRKTLTDSNSNAAIGVSLDSGILDILKLSLAQDGFGASITPYLKKETDNPCDPLVSENQPKEFINSDNVFPNIERDNFNRPSTSKESGQDTVAQREPKQEIFTNLLDVDQNVFTLNEATLRYVTSFDDNMEPVFVNAPYDSNEPYLVLLSSDLDKENYDVTNDVIIISSDKEQDIPQQQAEPEQDIDFSADTPEQVEEYPEADPLKNEPIDNAEAVVDSIYNIGAEETLQKESLTVSPRSPQAQRRDPVSTEVVVENEQAYIVGRSSAVSRTGGSTGGY